MRLIAFLLALTAFALTVIPCSVFSDEKASAGVIYSEELQSPDQEEDDCNTCSPFYLCGNCIGFAPLYQVIECNNSVEVLVKHGTFFKEAIVSLVSKPIWQPPKIV